MHDHRRRILAAAAKDAIGGEITVTRWRSVYRMPARGYWLHSGDGKLWDRASSAKALLAKAAENWMEVTTQEEDDGATLWRCSYDTDSRGSRCEYTFRTPRQRSFYASAVAAAEERREVAGASARPRAVGAASACRL